MSAALTARRAGRALVLIRLLSLARLRLLSLLLACRLLAAARRRRRRRALLPTRRHALRRAGPVAGAAGRAGPSGARVWQREPCKRKRRWVGLSLHEQVTGRPTEEGRQCAMCPGVAVASHPKVRRYGLSAPTDTRLAWCRRVGAAGAAGQPPTPLLPSLPPSLPFTCRRRARGRGGRPAGSCARRQGPGSRLSLHGSWPG